jgi:hypothetical protein
MFLNNSGKREKNIKKPMKNETNLAKKRTVLLEVGTNDYMKSTVFATRILITIFEDDKFVSFCDQNSDRNA